MNIVEINTVDYGSTGKIMLQTSELSRAEGMIAKTYSRAWKQQKAPVEGHTYFGSFLENGLHHILSMVTGLDSRFSVFGTRALLKNIEKAKPDVIHLHNLHGWYIDLPLFFKYIKKHHIPVIWTLHDCWAFTGHCPYFTMVKCDKWKLGCHACPQFREYPQSLVDNSRYMYKLKQEWFTGVKELTLVTPSEWLARLVKESFLKEYPVNVIHNGIDLNTFQPTPSNFRKKHGIGDKYTVLGVAFGWGKRKGLDVFIELARRLDHEKYQIVLVGTDNAVDKQLPDNIISIHRTQNQTELAEIYTAADVFANPTREENYPTVNMEAIACGTPVVTFETGGSPEILDETCGLVVPCDDIDAMEKEIIRICETKPYSKEACLKRAEKFDMYKKFMEYVKLYENCTYSTECTV